ncbi:MAG: ABC transporter ATP-binding protein [Bacteroidales bacterium]|nr:ABC transporter ATP-binding protein [Bacteroidales bacterium]MBN2819838.1 ABC transporter ATP-binding protein [Bacteroidales bacterium]
MRDAFRIFIRYSFKYKGYLFFNILFTLLGAITGVFSLVAIMPLLKVLFGINNTEYFLRDIDFSLFPLKLPNDDDLLNNIYYHIAEVIKSSGELRALVLIALFGATVFFMKTAFEFMDKFTMVKIRNRVVRDIRNKLFKKITSLPIGYFNDERKGDIIARATTDIAEVEHSVMSSMNFMFKYPVTVLFYLVAMIIMSWQLTIFVLILLPVSGGLIGYIGKSLRKKSFKAQTKMGEILSTIEESLGGLRIIKAFNAEQKMGQKQASQNQEYRKLMDNVMTRHSLASPLSEFLGVVVVMVLIVVGGRMVLSGESPIPAEKFIFYLTLFYGIINPTKSFSSSYYNIQKGLASMDRIEAVLKTESNIIVKKQTIPVQDFKDEISYSGVWFRYQESYVLEEINITLKKGETVALVGQSGSGKSTIADLLPRFYDVNKGSISVDGVDVRDMNPAELRSKMGIVNQEAILFNDTIYNNISFGVKNSTPQEVEQAARIANAHEFIIQTEDGYQTNIGDRGNRLSGGQRQRISIARAILRNPPILILDEATSALDTESEKLVQDALNKLMKNRTSLVIAHRLSTIRNADKIYVLREGKIIESGNYDELLAKGGEFKMLHDIQFGA